MNPQSPMFFPLTTRQRSRITPPRETAPLLGDVFAGKDTISLSSSSSLSLEAPDELSEESAAFCTTEMLECNDHSWKENAPVVFSGDTLPLLPVSLSSSELDEPSDESAVFCTAETLECNDRSLQR
jgi:hypothetical protein